MNKNVVFTIVAKNYIGLAQILESSLNAHNKDTDFFIIVADEFLDSFDKKNLPSNIIIARNTLNIPDHQWIDMSFKYDLTEFCTSIKPASFLYFMENTNYEKIIYLDPDIYIYSSLSPIYEVLENRSIILTPHVTKIRDHYKGDLPESNLLGSGVFNLGFCGVRKNTISKKMLTWWHERLNDKCFIDAYNFYFTDQKWMDFLPCYFTSDELHISQHLGMNIAPWNFFEREIFIENDKIRVRNREESSKHDNFPVIFVHYSGYNYVEMKKGIVIQNNISNIKNYEDIKLLTDVYSNAVYEKREIFDGYIKEKYSFGLFESGETITKFHRRMYRSLIDKGVSFENPFLVSDNSLYQKLKAKGMITNSTMNIGKVNRDDLKGIEGKLKIFNVVTRLLYKIIGIEKYTLLIRLFGPFSRFESQIHLVNSDFDKENIKR
jgi:hypothetical protein